MKSRTSLLISSLVYFVAMIFVRTSGYTVLVDALNILAVVFLLIGALKIQKERRAEKTTSN